MAALRCTAVAESNRFNAGDRPRPVKAGLPLKRRSTGNGGQILSRCPRAADARRRSGNASGVAPLGVSPSALSITLGYHRIRDVREQPAELVRRQIAEARIVVFGERLCNLVPVRGDQVLARKR